MANQWGGRGPDPLVDGDGGALGPDHLQDPGGLVGGAAADDAEVSDRRWLGDGGGGDPTPRSTY